MATERKEKHGHMDCEECAANGVRTRVLVRISPKTETLSVKCDECDAPDVYAPKGSERWKRWMRKIELIAAPAVEKKNEGKPAPSAPPAKPPADKPRERMPWE